MDNNNKNHSCYGLGRRKTAVARVRLRRGDAAESVVNEVELKQYFPTAQMKTSALSPLTLTSQEDTWKIEARVEGGGKQAQAEAIKLGAARALVSVNADWRRQLKSAGLLTRDSRVKERKKYGLKRARRAPQFSKR